MAKPEPPNVVSIELPDTALQPIEDALWDHPDPNVQLLVQVLKGNLEAGLWLRARQWAWDAGLPGYQAAAFAQWVCEAYDSPPSDWSTSKLAWDYNADARVIVSRWGALPDDADTVTPRLLYDD